MKSYRSISFGNPSGVAIILGFLRIFSYRTTKKSKVRQGESSKKTRSLITRISEIGQETISLSFNTRTSNLEKVNNDRQIYLNMGCANSSELYLM